MFKTRQKEKKEVPALAGVPGSEKREDRGITVTRSEKQLVINPYVITATTIIGDKVKDKNGRTIGKIEEVTFDLTRGKVLYLVMSTGGFLGIGDRFFAVPLSALTIDVANRTFRLEVEGKRARRWRGFNKESWPDMPQWPPQER